MSAVLQVLVDAAELGVSRWVDDGRLRLRGPAGAVAGGLRDRAAGVRDELVELLRSGLDADRSRWADAARDSFEERAAVMEYAGDLSRAEAELRAEARLRLDAVRALGEH